MRVIPGGTFQTPTEPAPFQAPRMKLDRAAQHIAAIKSDLLEYVARRPVETFPAPVPGNFHMYGIRLLEILPPHLPAALGDAIHNLRTALDIMACDMVRLNTGKEDVSGVYFPFARDAEGLEVLMKKRRTHDAGEHVVNLVRELRPFVGGNIALRRVHDLDVLDKHTSIIRIAYMFHSAGPESAEASSGRSRARPSERLRPLQFSTA